MRTLIEQTEAFLGPHDPGITFVDGANMVFPHDAQRQFLKLEGITVKEDGPFGWSGAATAKVTFTWRWSGGPLGEVVYRSTAKLHYAGEAWRVYDDLLRDELWRAERGEE